MSTLPANKKKRSSRWRRRPDDAPVFDAARLIPKRTHQPPLPVIEIGHLFPNYRPQRAAQQNEPSTANRDAVLPPENVMKSRKNNRAAAQRGADVMVRVPRRKLCIRTLPQSRKRSAVSDPSVETQDSTRAKRRRHGETCEEEGAAESSSQVNHSKSQSKLVPWNQRFKELKAYKEKYGTCNVPCIKKDGPYRYKQLGAWVNNQRHGYKGFTKAKKAGEPTTSCKGMTEERITQLEDIGFAWSVRSELAPSWDARFEELKAYREQHGSCNVPKTKKCVPDKLGVWVQTQRNGYKAFMKAQEAGKPTTSCQGMTKERIGRLEQIGFAWSARTKNVSWNTRFEELKAYRESYGTCNVPNVKDGPLKQLGIWVQHQRQGYKAFMKAKDAGLPTTSCNGMTEERIASLQEIGFVWSVISGKH